MVTNERYRGNMYNSSNNYNNYSVGTYKNQDFNSLEPARYNNFVGQGTNNMQEFLPRNDIQPYRGTYGSQGRSDNSMT